MTTKARVLLVEDDPLQADVTKEILQNNGYDVLWAQDGVSAIKTVKTERPDIVLLDVILPGLDGYEVCRWLKMEESTKGIPVIMLTVKKELSDKISGLQIGADDYLPKPYNELELNARIYASLRTKALQDELRMKNRQLEELLGKVEHMAITDALTGLYNRRRFHDVLTKEFERARRYATPFSLVMLDVDHFKKVNDTYGHHVGDVVLKEVANIIPQSIREVDTAARYGGEEFMIILPNTEKERAVHVAERMRESIAVNTFQGVGCPVTVSIGLCGLPDDILDNEDRLLLCADFAMYRAKQNGRNRVESADGQDIKNLK
ncbi:MAG: diguanylate cyclase [Nitrospirae bacterium]|nr:diguanylate cyclase [Nitrospirota bacterium]